LTVQQAEQARQIKRLVEEIIRLSEQELPPEDYYREFLKRVLSALEAPAGAVWVRNPQGNFSLQYQINVQEVGLDRTEAGHRSHAELVRQAAIKGQPMVVPPNSGEGPTDNENPGPGNPTNFVILMTPILVDKQVAGLVEVWQDPRLNPTAFRNQSQFLVQVSALATVYTRNHRLRQMVGQEKLWTQLEAFTRQIHATLNPTEVSYLVANEARRLVECDRISIGLRRGKKAAVEAISGADVVEKRSNLVQLMRMLFQRVMVWGEKLIYTGIKDDSLPPDVLDALDNYLAESNSKLLVIMPLRDERESETKKPPRSALMMECFEPNATPDQLVARLEVVGRHAASAFYNALEHRRIPMRWIWMPIAKVQEGLGGKARAIITSITLAVVLLIGALIWVPYPLTMKAKGNLLPVERQYVFPPVGGTIREFKVDKGSVVFKGTPIVLMRMDPENEKEITTLQGDINTLEREIDSLLAESRDAKEPSARNLADSRAREKKKQRDSLVKKLANFQELFNVDDQVPGGFLVTSPMDGIVLNSDFRQELTGKYVKSTDPILRVGRIEGEWEIEVKIPQKHIGQVLQAFDKVGKDELDVYILLSTAPAQGPFLGKLHRKDVGGQANPNKEEMNESEPVVRAWVRIEGDDIPEGKQLPRDFLLTDTQVDVKIACGKRAMGYSLFYGVWEYFYEKVVFFFY
jgi:hypothetical protein